MALLLPGPGYIFFNHKLKKKITPLTNSQNCYNPLKPHCSLFGVATYTCGSHSGLVSHLFSKTGAIMQP